ncbi:thiol reductase thioredoxin [Anaerobacillus alkalidiazotrophicus]|uniref:Thiol reductase thioredoxin n=1 Tax=Anaerobacillus alkalidiazotrophicus TaxID=472963 RepID=A0A1S2M5F3_9BACI|nr:thioredoxin family protein [Anaerobacillus alkalidiazotrophicus]OIJ18214.1 thiol reductase thioredoxin [Anaerobacillus alkalidiazotrophicus]OIJ19693.1 thiol reductase thioredoxin [Anaerobacillus alkalidiazotrophicus]
MKSLLSKEMFIDEIKNGLSVVVFSADWCPDCRVIEPLLPEVEKIFSQFTFYYADRDKLIDLCGEMDIFGIPSFVAFQNGNELARFVSKDRKTKEEIEQFLQKALEKVDK